MDILTELFKLGKIILVDLVLAGDNAIVIGLVAAKFTAEHRRRVILYGIGAAVLLRILFAILTVQLLQIPGLLLIGGLLLLWICWKLWVDLRAADAKAKTAAQTAEKTAAPTKPTNPPLIPSIMQVVIADLSMSLDNVLAVAAIADGDTRLLIIGLAIAVAFMTFAAAAIANLLQRHRWIGYLGLAVIIYVGFQMTIRGTLQLHAYLQPLA